MGIDLYENGLFSLSRIVTTITTVVIPTAIVTTSDASIYVYVILLKIPWYCRDNWLMVFLNNSKSFKTELSTDPSTYIWRLDPRRSGDKEGQDGWYLNGQDWLACPLAGVFLLSGWSDCQSWIRCANCDGEP